MVLLLDYFLVLTQLPPGALVCLGSLVLMTVPLCVPPARLRGGPSALALRWPVVTPQGLSPRRQGQVWFPGPVSWPGTVQAPRGSTQEGGRPGLCDRGWVCAVATGTDGTHGGCGSTGGL